MQEGRGILTNGGDAQFLRCFEIRSDVVQEHHLGRFHLEQVQSVLVELWIGFPVRMVSSREACQRSPFYEAFESAWETYLLPTTALSM